MKGFSTQTEFNGLPIEVQKSFIYGWAVAVLQLNEEISEETNCFISGVREASRGGFAIDYEWTAWTKRAGYSDESTGHNWVDESEDQPSSLSFWLPSIESMDSAAFDFHNELTENVKYDEEYDGKSDDNDEDYRLDA